MKIRVNPRLNRKLSRISRTAGCFIALELKKKVEMTNQGFGKGVKKVKHKSITIIAIAVFLGSLMAVPVFAEGMRLVRVTRACDPCCVQRPVCTVPCARAQKHETCIHGLTFVSSDSSRQVTYVSCECPGRTRCVCPDGRTKCVTRPARCAPNTTPGPIYQCKAGEGCRVIATRPQTCNTRYYTTCYQKCY